MNGVVVDNVGSGNEFSTSDFNRFLRESIDLKEAVDELDKCIKKKEEILKVYNGTGELYDSPLFLIVNTGALPPKIDRKRLLTHPVMRRVVEMKWQLFAKRNFLVQFAMNCLLVISMTFSVCNDYGNYFQSVVPVACFFMVSLLLILVVSLRWYSIKRNGWWYFMTIVVPFLAFFLLCYFIDNLGENLYYFWASRLNDATIALMALYFLSFEMSTFFASFIKKPEDMPLLSNYPRLQRVLYYTLFWPFMFLIALIHYPFHSGEARYEYFNSAFNFFRIPTFAGVFLYGVIQYVPNISNDTNLYLGLLLTFMLWVLSLQYLRVHSTAGYLLPMMSAITGDMVRFMTFYAPFQIAYTIAYFQLFRTQVFMGTYSTLSNSFITTFLVLLGTIDVGPFEDLSKDNGPYVFGFVILLTHATLVIVMWLNMIVAMMTKTMDGGLEKARVQAIISFAEYVSRCEKINGLHRITLDDLEIEHIDEVSPLVKSQDNVKYDGSNEKRVDEKTADGKTTDDEEKNQSVFDIFAAFDKDWELELEDMSTDDRINSLRDELTALIKKNEAKVQQVIDLLLEIKKVQ